MKPYCLLIFFIAFGFSPIFSQGGSLHFIATVDNINPDIREGCARDFEETYKVFQAVAQDAGMAFYPQLLYFDIDQVQGYVEDQFSCGPNDVVVFFYSGHGRRYEYDDPGMYPLPYLYFCNRQVASGQTDPLDCELDLEIVLEELEERAPRLVLLINDSCNDDPDVSVSLNAMIAQTTAIDDQLNREAMDDSSLEYEGIELITEYYGTITVSASIAGKVAITNNEVGSYFILNFLNRLREGLAYNRFSSWESMLSQVRRDVEQQTQGQQIPYYKIH